MHLKKHYSLQRIAIMHVVAILCTGTLVYSYTALELHVPHAVSRHAAKRRGQIYSADHLLLAGNSGKQRRYPEGVLAGPLLGFAGVDGGLEGVEASQNLRLSQGQNVNLTIDSRIQTLAEARLQETLQTHQAEYGSVVVLDTSTGRILAMASAPTDNPNQALDTQARWRKDRPAVTTYEPGSEMKALTVAAVLERHLATPATVLDTPMQRRLPGATIHDVVPHPLHLTTPGVLRYSSNVGISQLVGRLGPQGLYSALSDFGIGRGVGALGVPAARGRLNAWQYWGPLEAATNGFGQGVTTTTLEFAAAFNTIANGGIYCQPTLLDHQLPVRHRVISATTALTMRKLLYRVIHDGISKAAGLPGYQMAGKTGTAQVVINGRYSPSVFVSTFSGFFPAEQPRYTISVMVRGAKVKYQGSELAAPLVRDIAAGLASLSNQLPRSPSALFAQPLPFSGSP